MKLSAYHRNQGDSVIFVKGTSNTWVLKARWDRVYVTTLFTFEWKRIESTIDFALKAAGGEPNKVFAGGIAVSLMLDSFAEQAKWNGIRFIKGLLDGPPGSSLGLALGEPGAEDLNGTPIEELVPDYSILRQIKYQYPVHDAYFGYASRGCIRKCSFCGVPKLEGALREMPPIKGLVEGIIRDQGEKKDLVLMDNNITASARYQEVIAEILDLGFHSGARLERDGRRLKRRLDFNQGVDARILAKSEMYLREMAKTCISPLRIAFDHLGLQKVYRKAVEMAASNGITSLSNYMLYNFMDNPTDLYRRMRLNLDLNEELGIRIWSFPMRYQPVTLKDRSHIGKKWNRYHLRSFQIMLQATRGVVSGNPSFFRHAYGKNEMEFLRLIEMPHAFIFHRSYYEKGEGKAAKEEYEALRGRLSDIEAEELSGILKAPSSPEGLGLKYYRRVVREGKVSPAVEKLLRFHALGTHMKPGDQDPDSLWEAPRVEDQEYPTEEERVEDAGLFDGQVQVREGIAI